MKTTDGKFALIVCLVFCGIFIFMINYMEGNRQEIKTLKAKNLELAKNQLILSDKILNSKNTEIKLLDFLQRLTYKVVSIDSLKIKD